MNEEFFAYLLKNPQILEPSLKILDHSLPIWGNEVFVDIIAQNIQGDLYILKIISQLRQKDITSLLKIVHWTNEHKAMLHHFYSFPKNLSKSKIKVLVLCENTDESFSLWHHCSKDLPFEIKIFQGIGLSDNSSWSLSEFKPKEFGPQGNFAPNQNGSKLPDIDISLNKDELNDFFSDSWDEDEFDDLEVTVSIQAEQFRS